MNGPPQAAAPLRVGGPGGEAGANSFYEGLVDDLRIYSCAPMNEEQIRRIMEGGAP